MTIEEARALKRGDRVMTQWNETSPKKPGVVEAVRDYGGTVIIEVDQGSFDGNFLPYQVTLIERAPEPDSELKQEVREFVDRVKDLI